MHFESTKIFALTIVTDPPAVLYVYLSAQEERAGWRLENVRCTGDKKIHLNCSHVVLNVLIIKTMDPPAVLQPCIPRAESSTETCCLHQSSRSDRRLLRDSRHRRVGSSSHLMVCLQSSALWQGFLPKHSHVLHSTSCLFRSSIHLNMLHV